MVVFGQKWLCSGKSCCIRLKEVVLGETSCIPTKVVLFDKKRLFLGRKVVLGPNRMYSVKSCCNWAKLVVFWKRGCIRAKVIVFGKK